MRHQALVLLLLLLLHNIAVVVVVCTRAAGRRKKGKRARSQQIPTYEILLCMPIMKPQQQQQQQRQQYFYQVQISRTIGKKSILFCCIYIRATHIDGVITECSHIKIRSHPLLLLIFSRRVSEIHAGATFMIHCMYTGCWILQLYEV